MARTLSPWAGAASASPRRVSIVRLLVDILVSCLRLLVCCLMPYPSFAVFCRERWAELPPGSGSATNKCGLGTEDRVRFAHVEIAGHYSSHVQVRVRNTLNQAADDERCVLLHVTVAGYFFCCSRRLRLSHSSRPLTGRALTPVSSAAPPPSFFTFSAWRSTTSVSCPSCKRLTLFCWKATERHAGQIS